jgi:hypothetical protein
VGFGETVDLGRRDEVNQHCQHRLRHCLDAKNTYSADFNEARYCGRGRDQDALSCAPKLYLVVGDETRAAVDQP